MIFCFCFPFWCDSLFCSWISSSNTPFGYRDVSLRFVGVSDFGRVRVWVGGKFFLFIGVGLYGGVDFCGLVYC